MDDSAVFEQFIRGGLGTFGIEPDDVDMAVIGAADAIWGPPMRALLAADLDGIAPEHNPDLSIPPQA